MLPKGSMTNVKKGIGIALLAIAGGSLLGIEQINTLVGQYPLIVNLVLIGAGYLLIIAGRQR